MDGLMSSVGIQIQRAINEAIKEQVLPQIQASLGASSGQGTRKGKNVPSERPERSSEESYSQKVRRISSRELPRNRLSDEDRVNTHDMVTGDNEFPILFLSYSRDISRREQYLISPTVITTIPLTRHYPLQNKTLRRRHKAHSTD